MITMILILGTFEWKYEGLRIVVTPSAGRELVHHGYTQHTVLKILEYGYGCSASRRKENIIEKCIRKGNKEVKAVVARVETTHPGGKKEEIWILIHFGVNTYRKGGI